MWMDPENMMLSERSRQEETQGVTPLMGNIQNRPIHRHREWVPACQRLGRWRRGKLIGRGLLLR